MKKNIWVILTCFVRVQFFCAAKLETELVTDLLRILLSIFFFKEFY